MRTKTLLIWLCLVSCCLGQRVVKQSTAYNLRVVMYDSTDHITEKTSLTLTVTESKSGTNSYSSISPTKTEIGNGAYNIALTTSHLDTVGDTLVRITATGADPVTIALVVRENVLGDTLPVTVHQWNDVDLPIANVAGVPLVDVQYVLGDNGAAANLQDFANSGYNSAAHKVVEVSTVDELSSNLDKAGYDLLADQSNVTVGFLNTNSDKTGYSLSPDQSTVTIGTINTNNDKTGYSLDITPPTVNDIWTFGNRTLTAGTNIVLVKGTGITGFNDITAGSVWAVGTRELSSGNNIVLAKGTGVTGFNDPTAAAVASATRTELSVELGRIDTNIGSRLATGGYTAPDNATIAAIQSAINGMNNLSQQNVSDALKLAPTGGTPATGSVYRTINKIQADVNSR